MKVDQDGAYYETLKWIAYMKWTGVTTTPSPAFACPHCAKEIPGLPFDSDQGKCPYCKKCVFLTDMVGFHLDMDENSAPDSVPSAYMLIMETLMLFTAIRFYWDSPDRKVISTSLFIKDGPLTLRSQYSKLVPPIRSFLENAKIQGRPVHVIGQEKTGAFADHLASIVRFAPPHERGGKPSFAVLSHDYVRREPLDRMAEFDVMRMFYVALSRAKNLLVLAHYCGRGQSVNDPFQSMLDDGFPRINEFKVQSLPKADHADDDLPKTYSYTGDFLLYKRCPRQYMAFRKYRFAPARSQTMFFGSLVHQTIDDLHQHLIAMRSGDGQQASA